MSALLRRIDTTGYFWIVSILCLGICGNGTFAEDANILTAEQEKAGLLAAEIESVDLLKPIRSKPVLQLVIGSTLFYSEKVEEKEATVAGCRGKNIYSVDLGFLAKKRSPTSPELVYELPCIVSLDQEKQNLVVHYRRTMTSDSRWVDELVRVANATDPKAEKSLVRVFPFFFGDPEKDNLNIELAFLVDSLRTKGATTLERGFASRVWLGIQSSRVAVITEPITTGQGLFFQTISLEEDSPKLSSPVFLPALKGNLRRIADFKFSGDLALIAWEGDSRSRGRFSVVGFPPAEDFVKNPRYLFGSDSDIPTTDWKELGAQKFSVKEPGNIVHLSHGFVSLDTASRATWDAPFGFYFAYKEQKAFQLPYLSKIGQRVHWVNRWNGGLIVSEKYESPEALRISEGHVIRWYGQKSLLIPAP